MLEYFLANREKVYAEHRNEQAYLSRAIAMREKLEYWPAEWCLSFKRHFMRPFPLGYFLEPQPRIGTKVIVFHGEPNPDCARDGWRSAFGLRAVKKTPWLANLWTEIDSFSPRA